MKSILRRIFWRLVKLTFRITFGLSRDTFIIYLFLRNRFLLHQNPCKLICFHLGPSKTASTYLQSTIFPLIAKRNCIFYLGRTYKYIKVLKHKYVTTDAIIFNPTFLIDKSLSSGPLQVLAYKMLLILSYTSNECIVLSSELLSHKNNKRYSRFSSDLISRLAVFGINFKLLVVFRDPYSWFLSKLSHELTGRDPCIYKIAVDGSLLSNPIVLTPMKQCCKHEPLNYKLITINFDEGDVSLFSKMCSGHLNTRQQLVQILAFHELTTAPFKSLGKILNINDHDLTLLDSDLRSNSNRTQPNQRKKTAALVENIYALRSNCYITDYTYSHDLSQFQ